ncbi:MAG: CopG family transcriptional regulator [Bacillota bacterium]|nr:CopG family transcriptional regulator [Bacillota bacterium]
MVRMQVQLTEKQVRNLRQIAELRHVSVARLVREAVDLYLLRSMPDRPRALARAAAVIGKFSSRRRETSRKHDRYLAEAFGSTQEAPRSPEVPQE